MILSKDELIVPAVSFTLALDPLTILYADLRDPRRASEGVIV